MVIWVVLRKASGFALRYALKRAAAYAVTEVVKKVAVVGAQRAAEHFRGKNGFSEASYGEHGGPNGTQESSFARSSTSTKVD
tara:strand:+ start:219 stop:464 length:246 start_codon:yes stop_codon:yes gene_type:complete